MKGSHQVNTDQKSTEVLITGCVCEIYVDVTRAIWPGQYTYSLCTADRSGGISWEEVSDQVWSDPDQAFAAGIARAEQCLFPSAPSPDETDGRILPEMLPLRGDETIVAGSHQRLVPVSWYDRPMLDMLTKVEQYRLAIARMNYGLTDIAAIASIMFLSFMVLAVPGILVHSMTLFWLAVTAGVLMPTFVVLTDWWNELYMLRRDR